VTEKAVVSSALLRVAAGRPARHDVRLCRPLRDGASDDQLHREQQRQLRRLSLRRHGSVQPRASGRRHVSHIPRVARTDRVPATPTARRARRDERSDHGAPRPMRRPVPARGRRPSTPPPLALPRVVLLTPTRRLLAVLAAVRMPVRRRRHLAIRPRANATIREVHGVLGSTRDQSRRNVVNPDLSQLSIQSQSLLPMDRSSALSCDLTIATTTRSLGIVR
jgi:hypothetical protein